MSQPAADALSSSYRALRTPQAADRIPWARTVCDFVEHAVAQPREIPAENGHAAATLQQVLDAAYAPQGETAFSELQMFLAACESLLDGVMDVNQFSSPAAHKLFALLEAGVATTLVQTLRSERGDLLAQRESDLVTARGVEVRSSVSEEAVLAACIPLAFAALGTTGRVEIASFLECLYSALAKAHAVRSEGKSAYYAKAAVLAAEAVQQDREHRGLPSAEALLGSRAFELCTSLLAAAARRDRLGTSRLAAQILRQKATYAPLHHQDQRLGTKRVVEWLTGDPLDVEGLLNALYESPWIDKSNIKGSRFFAQLTGPRGKMHGVFSEPELEILVRALETRENSSSHADSRSVVSEFLQHAGGWAQAEPPPEQRASAPMNARDRYFALLADDSAPALLKRTAEETLAAAGRELISMRKTASLPTLWDAFAYSPDSLSERIDDMYKSQAIHSHSSAIPHAAADILAMHLRFAPMALVDGCWLSRIVGLRQESPALMLLYGIYADEVGNGNMRHNHANIYIELLASFGVDIPGAASPSLRQHAAIPSQAYKLPAFLLALGVAAPARIPEVLGTTLAIELSGLDGFYEWMIRHLEIMNKDAAFWRIHVSIDNYSSGHSRQALQAIIHYMDDVVERHGRDAATLVWQRTWESFVLTAYLLNIEMITVLGAPSKASTQ